MLDANFDLSKYWPANNISAEPNVEPESNSSKGWSQFGLPDHRAILYKLAGDPKALIAPNEEPPMTSKGRNRPTFPMVILPMPWPLSLTDSDMTIRFYHTII